MKWIVLTISIVFVVSIPNSKAQTIVHVNGQILDSLVKSPIDFANVFLESNGEILGATFSDEEGKFSFEIDNLDSVKINISIIGYKNISRWLEFNPSQTAYDYVFYLETNEFDLKEIVIEESYFSYKKNDTTNYELKNFVDSTEYSVEDVLKKLPGVQVDNQGGIKYNGKHIDKVLIEGDDLFGHNYTLGTKNLRAQTITKVQVIENFEDNPVLKSISNSEKVVLNLNLSEEFKNSVAGAGDIGGGINTVGELINYLQLNVFNIRKKGKTLLFGNLNNVGFDAKGEVQYFNPPTSELSIGENRKAVSPLINIQEAQNIGLPDKFTLNNQNNLLSLSHLKPLTKTLKLQLNTSFNTSKEEQNINQQNDFWTLQDTISFEEDYTFSNKNMETAFSVSSTYIGESKQLSIKTLSSFLFSSANPEELIYRTSSNQLDSINFMNKQNNVDTYHALELSKKLGAYSIGQFLFSYSSDKLVQKTAANNRRNENAYRFFGLDHKIFQQNDITNKSFDLDLNYLWVKKQMKFKTLISYSNEKITVNNEIQNSNKNSHVGLTLHNFKMELRGSQTFSKFKITGGTFMKGQELRASGIQNKEPRYNFNLNSYISGSYNWTSQLSNEIRLQYKKNELLLKPTNNNPYLTNYQTIDYGNNQYWFGDEWSGILNFRYLNASKKESFYLTLESHKTINNVGSNLQIEEDLFTNRYLFGVDNETHRMEMNYEGLSKKLKSRIAIRGIYSYSIFQNQINEARFKNNLAEQSIFFDYGSAFKGSVNFYFTVLLKKIKIRSQDSQLALTSLTFNTIQNSFKLRIKPIKPLTTNIIFHYITGTQNNGDFPFNYFASEFQMTYKLKTRRGKPFNISLEMNNLLNQDEYSNLELSNYYRNRRRIKAIPFFFLIKCDFSF